MRTPTPWTLPRQPATRAELRAAGVSDTMIRTQLDAGRLVQVRHGVVVAADAWPDDPAARHLVRAHAEQAASPGAVLSHASAGVAWNLPHPGFEQWHEQPVSLTLPPGAGGRSGGSWHFADLAPTQVTRDADGYPVTSLARTAVDLATSRPLPDALVILDAAARQLVASYVSSPRRSDYVNPTLVGASRSALRDLAPRRFGRALVEAVDLVEPCRESPAESLTAGHLHLSGLPLPQFQARLVTPHGTFYPDVFWPELRVIGECDGAVKYTSAEVMVDEKWREQVLRDLGYRIVRWLGREIMTVPWEVMARIGRAVGH